MPRVGMERLLDPAAATLTLALAVGLTRGHLPQPPMPEPPPHEVALTLVAPETPPPAMVTPAPPEPAPPEPVPPEPAPPEPASPEPPPAKPIAAEPPASETPPPEPPPPEPPPMPAPAPVLPKPPRDHPPPRPHRPSPIVHPRPAAVATLPPTDTPPAPVAAPRPALPSPASRSDPGAEAGYAARLRAILGGRVAGGLAGPAARMMRPSGVARVGFTLGRGGSVRAVRLLASSGSALIDQFALASIGAGGYPPMPPDAYAGADEHGFTVEITVVPGGATAS